MARQRFVASRRPVADLLLRRHRRIPLRRRPFVDDAAHEIDLAAKLRQHRRRKDLFLGQPERLSGLEHDEKMARRLGMNELVGDLLADRAHQVAVDFQERDVLDDRCMRSAC